MRSRRSTYSGYRAELFRRRADHRAARSSKPAMLRPRTWSARGRARWAIRSSCRSSFMRYAVDFKGEGHKDIWGSVPDALASTANYLKSFGWRSGETWGYEVSAAARLQLQQCVERHFGEPWRLERHRRKRANGKAFPREHRRRKPLHADGRQWPGVCRAAEFRRHQALQQFQTATPSPSATSPTASWAARVRHPWPQGHRAEQVAAQGPASASRPARLRRRHPRWRHRPQNPRCHDGLSRPASG